MQRNNIQFNTPLWMFARRMIISGYAARIIELETSLSYKQIQKVRDHLDKEGVKYPRTIRKIRSTSSIINTQAKRIHASIFMQVYSLYGGVGTKVNVDITALDQAYETYLSILGEMPLLESDVWQPLTVTDVWCLAQELRRGIAKVKTCDPCNTSYYVSKNQMSASTCPFCTPIADTTGISRLSTNKT